MDLQALWDVTQQFNNKNGSILTSGKIYIYFLNRTALATTYHDEAGTVVNSNPVLLDNNGRATVFADPVYSYTIVVCDYYGKELFSQDIILHNAIATVENVLITGSDGSVLVDTTELPNGVQYDLSVNTDIIATKQSVDGVKSDLDDLTLVVNNNTKDIDDLTLVVNNNTIDIDNIQVELTDKKDKQTTLTFDGSATKTVKKITQNANGEMTVEFQDIDLPPEVPNVEITSPNGTIDVQSSTDVGTNTKTFAIDVAGENGAKNYAFLTSEMPVNTSEMALEYTDIHTNGIHWNTIDQRLEFSEDIKLIDLNFNVAYDISTANGISYDDLILYIYSDGQVLEKETYSIDTSIAKHICKFNKKILDPSNLQFTVKVPKNGAIAATIDINDETFKSIGGGSTYYAGDAIDITNSEISVKYGKGLTVNASNTLEVKAGNGLTFNEDTLEIEINNEVTDVVAAVEKLQRDLDTKLTVNFDMANITHTYDFANPGVTTLSNGATLLCQAFTVPINNEIRISNEQEDPTLIGIYAKQSYGSKIMLAIYVYDFDTGYTEYVADTGPVTVAAGRNEFPIKHINDNITELKSNCVYYAALYLPSSHSNGLYLASCQSYSNASYINATPRFTIGVQNITYNGSEISLESDTTGRLDYNDGLGNYYIGPWSDGYNEIPSAPRFFMQLRNGKVEEPAEPFDNISEYTVSAQTIDSLFTNASELGSPNYPVVYREVTPERDITIDWWQFWSPESSDPHKLGAITYSSGFNNILYNKANVTVTDLGQSDGLYARKYTPDSSITLTAGTTYRFPVWLGNSNYTDNCITYDTPATSTVLHLFQSAWSINEWASYKRLNNVAAMPLILHDTDNNTYRI